jgi:hypothetical protein
MIRADAADDLSARDRYHMAADLLICRQFRVWRAVSHVPLEKLRLRAKIERFMQHGQVFFVLIPSATLKLK